MLQTLVFFYFFTVALQVFFVFGSPLLVRDQQCCHLKILKSCCHFNVGNFYKYFYFLPSFIFVFLPHSHTSLSLCHIDGLKFSYYSVAAVVVVVVVRASNWVNFCILIGCLAAYAGSRQLP